VIAGGVDSGEATGGTHPQVITVSVVMHQDSRNLLGPGPAGPDVDRENLLPRRTLLIGAVLPEDSSTFVPAANDSPPHTAPGSFTLRSGSPPPPVRDWTVSISDVTAASEKLPAEHPYPLPGALSTVIGAL
jgi:hypothetical protein